MIFNVQLGINIHSSQMWTIHCEFYDHYISRATFLLDLAVSQEEIGRKAHQLRSLTEVCAWLEVVRRNDEVFRFGLYAHGSKQRTKL